MAGSNTPPINLQILETKLRDWKKWERDNGKPMVFSKAEEAALRLLTAVNSEPDLDDDNYIGKLNEALQRKKLVMPPGTPSEETLIDPSTKQSRYRVYYTLPNGQGKFPRPGYGYEPGEEAPAFSQKKKAKQFAAKWALSGLTHPPPSDAVPDDDDANDKDYVDGSDSAPDSDSDSDGSSHYYEAGDSDIDADDDDDGDDDDNKDDENPNSHRAEHPPPSVQNSPERKKLKIEDAEAQNGAPVSLPPASKKHSTSLPSDSSLPKRVEALCKKLGIDAPKYHAECDANGMWSGRLTCWADGLMPETLGRVQGAQSKMELKTLMAKEMLAWLKAENQKRESQCVLGDRFSKMCT
ncbi:hypothetical protein AK830_g3043 [Neonectria ditissima]|uniref:DRBM domain-containing protein n=1 Tax=Neonectria ditissima TaxID=78410 RepID=A0A0P7BT03_9HYPO|nr:hypothetical protein AK830_g3043 [Neonectria ditissima]